MYCVALNKQDVSLSLSPLFIYLLTNLFIYVIGFLCRFFLFRFFFSSNVCNVHPCRNTDFNRSFM